MISSGARVGSVDNNAIGSKRFSGSRISTQRMWAGGKPPWYQMAVPEQNSMRRWDRPYQSCTVRLLQRVLESASLFCREGRQELCQEPVLCCSCPLDPVG